MMALWITKQMSELIQEALISCQHYNILLNVSKYRRDNIEVNCFRERESLQSGQTYENVISHETSLTLEGIHPRSHLLLQCGQDWCLGSLRAPSLECLMVSYVNQRSCMKTSKTQEMRMCRSLLQSKSQFCSTLKDWDNSQSSISYRNLFSPSFTSQ